MKLNNFLVSKSKYLSKILRHDPESAGITLDKEGYADVKELCKATGITVDELVLIVENNDKKRFAYNETADKIRASQGHSVKEVTLTLEKLETVPAVLYHGTTKAHLDSILKTGLDKRSRHHVHMSDSKETAQKVAERWKGEVVILSIDAMFMRAEDYKFYKSENGVYLTDIVPPKFITVLK